MPDKDSALIIEISQNVKYLRESFDEHKSSFREHIAHDDKIVQEYIRPLWEAHQQQKGALNAGKVMWGTIYSILALIGAYAGIRMGK